MSRVDAILTQLDLLNEKAKRSPKNIVSEQDCRKVYDQVCVIFPKATPDERVDLLIRFEGREALMAALVEYMARLSQHAAKMAGKDKRQDATTAIEQALITDAVIDGRTDLDVLHKIQNELLQAANIVHFDVEPFLQNLETPASVFVERSYHYYKQDNRAQAIRSLGLALQLDHTLRQKEKIAEFAKLLTGEAAHSAIMLLEDSYLRNSLIQDLDRKAKLASRTTTQTATMAKVDPDANILKKITGVFSTKKPS